MHPPPDLRKVQSAVVPFVWGLGDHILALPALRALAQLLRGKLSLLSAFSAPDLFFGDVGFVRIEQVHMDFRRKHGPLFDTRAAAEVLGRQDLFISLAEGYASDWETLSRRLQVKWSIGYFGDCLTDIEAESQQHAVDRAFAIPKLFADHLKPEDFSQPFPLPPASVAFADSVRSHLDGCRLLVIHGETKPKKRWPVEYFRETISRFLSIHRNYRVLEIARTQSIFGDDLPRGLIPLTGLPLSSCIALAAAADLLLCVDSVFLHVADLWRTPSVALFGPTSPIRWGFRFNSWARHVHAVRMADLNVELVLENLQEIADAVDTHEYRPLSLSPTASHDLVRWI